MLALEVGRVQGGKLNLSKSFLQFNVEKRTCVLVRSQIQITWSIYRLQTLNQR